jgi:Tfp pilus assembly protein PilN
MMAVVAVPVLLPIAFLAGVFQRPVSRTRAEVADLLEREAEGCGSDAEWDDFTCIRVADPELEAIRATIVRAEEEASLTQEQLKGYASHLRRV